MEIVVVARLAAHTAGSECSQRTSGASWTSSAARAGSLLAYGADARELCQRSAVFVDKILKGAKPADLPIERATFQLVVNLKTAAALGVTFPPTFLFQADEVIK